MSPTTDVYGHAEITAYGWAALAGAAVALALMWWWERRRGR